MNDYLDTYLKPVLDSIGKGSLFRTVFGYVLGGVAVLLTLGLLIGWITSFAYLGNATFLSGVAFLIHQVFLMCAIALVGATIWVRGRTILHLEPARFTLIPIFAVVVRLIGEVGLVFYVLMSVPYMLAIWFGASELVTTPLLAATVMLTPLNAFMLGVLILFHALIIGFLSLALAYLLAEIVEVIYRMAVDIRGAREALEGRSPDTARQSSKGTSGSEGVSQSVPITAN